MPRLKPKKPNSVASREPIADVAPAMTANQLLNPTTEEAREVKLSSWPGTSAQNIRKLSLVVRVMAINLWHMHRNGERPFRQCGSCKVSDSERKQRGIHTPQRIMIPTNSATSCLWSVCLTNNTAKYINFPESDIYKSHPFFMACSCKRSIQRKNS